MLLVVADTGPIGYLVEIGHIGILPQLFERVFVLVLSPQYPRGLVEAGKKLYLAGGVLAAFECKLKLTQRHLKKAFEASRIIADGITDRWGSPYRELHRPAVYGLLAHSHEWKDDPRAHPVRNIDKALSTMLSTLDHPRRMLDVLCVSDLGTWTATKSLTCGRHEIDEHGSTTWKGATDPSIHAGYLLRHKSPEFPFDTVGAMVVDLWTRLGRERSDLRPIADYFRSVPGLAGDGRGKVWMWRAGDLLSRPVQDELARLDSRAPQIPQPAKCPDDSSDFWSDWHHTFTW